MSGYDLWDSAALLSGLFSGLLYAAQAPPPPGPEPQDHLVITGRAEHPCVFITPADVERARQNAQRYAWARSARDRIIAEANKWLEKDVQSWIERLPEPGACFAYGFTGCPICGSSWGIWFGAKASWDHPGQVTCAQGHMLPDADHPDPGTGYLAPDGRIHYMIGSYNAWVVEQFTQYALQSLAEAYALTGDERYASTAAAIFDGLARIYPACDKGSWDYPSDPPSGRLNRPWYQVADTLTLYVYQYDLLYGSPALDTPSLVPGLTKRQNVERNLLQNGACYCYQYAFSGQLHNGHAAYLRGALAVGALLGIPEYVHTAISGPYSIYTMLENNIDRDGRYYETSESYSMHARNLYLEFAEILRHWRDEQYPEGVDLFAHPKFVSTYLLPAASLDAAGHFPNFGDSVPDTTSRFPAEPRFDPYDYCYAEHLYAYVRDPQVKETFAHILAYLSSGDLDALRARSGAWLWGGLSPAANTWLLWHAEPLPEAISPHLPPDLQRQVQRPVLFGQKGLAILRSGAGTGAQAAVLRFGPALNHGDMDDLGLNWYAKGYELTYDIGYGIATAHTHVGWANQTVSHCLVCVNETSQMATGRSGGSVHLFADLGGLKLVEASSEGSYEGENVRLYRRTVALVGDEPNQYLLDVFRVVGGKQHDYVFGCHSQEMSVNGVELGPEEDGSLAGLEQAWGERQGNDGDIVGFPNQPGWNPPPGNGYGFFYDMRRGRTEGPWSGTWHLGDKGEVHLRMTLLGQDRTEVIWAKAPGLYPSNPKAGYFLARRRGEEPLASTYVAVLEPYDTQPFIHSVQALAMEFAEGQPTLAPAALQVVRTNGEVDYIISGGQDDGLRVARTEHGEMRLSGAFGRVHVVEGQPVRLSLIGGGELTFGDLSLHAAGSALPGKVLRVDPQQNLVYTDARLPAEGWLVGSTVYFSNPAYSRNTAYRIEEIEPTGEGTALHLGRQSVILGIGRVGSVKSETELLSDVPHEYARTRNVSGAFFEGKLVIGDSGGQSLIKSFHVGEPSTIEVQSTAAFRSGERLTYYDLQAGDDLAIPVVAELRRLPDGTYEAVADVDLQATAEGRSVVVRPLSVE